MFEILCFMSVFLCRIIASTSEDCDYAFGFPTLEESVFTVEEKSNISLLFSLTSSCGHRPAANFRINVAKKYNNTSLTSSLVCQINHENGKCFAHAQSGARCKCLLQEGMFVLWKEAEKSDSTTWIWWKDGDYEKGKELVVNIIDSITRTSDSPEHASEDFFQADGKIVVSVIAGVIGLALVGLVVVYVRSDKRKPEPLRVRMRVETTDSEHQSQNSTWQRGRHYSVLNWDLCGREVQNAGRRLEGAEPSQAGVEPEEDVVVVHVNRPQSTSSSGENTYLEILEDEECDGNSGEQAQATMNTELETKGDGCWINTV